MRGPKPTPNSHVSVLPPPEPVANDPNQRRPQLESLPLPDHPSCFANSSLQFTEGIVRKVIRHTALGVAELEIHPEPVNWSGAVRKHPQPDSADMVVKNGVICIQRYVESAGVVPLSRAVFLPLSLVSHVSLC